MDAIKNIIEKHGGEDIKSYCLVNNHGYTFNLNGVKCDLRHWLNVYGARCDFWAIHTTGDKHADEQTKAIIDAISDEVNKHEEAK